VYVTQKQNLHSSFPPETHRRIRTAAVVTSFVPTNHLPSRRCEETRAIAIFVALSPFVEYNARKSRSAADGSPDCRGTARERACSTSLRTLGSRTSSLASGRTKSAAAIRADGNFKNILPKLYQKDGRRGAPPATAERSGIRTQSRIGRMARDRRRADDRTILRRTPNARPRP